MVEFSSDQRLRRVERIRRRKEFLSLYEQGRKLAGRFLVGYFSEGSYPWSRLGITVSRKIGRPVTRNRIKRRLREVFRRHKGAFATATDLVLNAKRSAAGASFFDLERDFLELVSCWNDHVRSHSHGRLSG